MDRIVSPTEWKVEESTGKSSQVLDLQMPLPLIGVVPDRRALMAAEIIAKASFNGCLSDAARISGKEDQELAEDLHISPGYMSRFMRGIAQQWARRIVKFMQSTGSLAPLQWIAFQMGCDVVVRSEVQRERDMLLARLAEIERRERMVA